jgi:uncharacterized membrane protein YGL010W
MKSVSQVLGGYAAYHRHPLNRMTHYFGIPLIVFSMLLILTIPSFTIADVSITAADILMAIVIAWYLKLDTLLGLLALSFLLPMLLVAEEISSSLNSTVLNWLFAFTFIIGWILQLLGHRIEKRRPALVDNFMQIFSAPLFIVSELVFSLGMRQQLAHQVEKIAQMKVLLLRTGARKQ